MDELKVNKTTQLGAFEEFILLSIVRLGKYSYGYSIGQIISAVTGKAVSMGAIYTTLDRLVRKNLVSTEKGQPTPVRGGRAKTYYSITNEGEQALWIAEQIRERIKGDSHD